MVVKIQRKDAVKANSRPRASTLNLRSIPGRKVSTVYSIVCPPMITGIMEPTMRNFKRAAERDQNSRRFGFFLESRIRTAATKKNKTRQERLDDQDVFHDYITPQELLIESY